MALVPGKTVLDAAHRGNWAVGAFNANNLEYVQGIIDGATSERAPVIIQASPGAIRYMGMDYITAVVRVAGDTAPIPVVLHLDHSKDLDELARCVERGFTSVMFDGSALDFEENVKLTKEAVDIAHKRGVSCEGELGRVPSSDRAWTHEELEEMMTSPDEAEEFVKRTGVDSLAVSVGSVHKMREKTAEVNAKRIGDLRRRVNVPLVLHGSSGVSDASLAQAVEAGISKVNIATLLNIAFSEALKDTVRTNPEEVDPRKILKPARQAVSTLVADRIRLLGSSKRA
jgi:fructose-bisphosphate aldolase class II